MNISLCFFARFREQLGIQQELYTLPIECNGHELLAQLAQRGEKWQDLFDNPRRSIGGYKSRNGDFRQRY
jgi:molybdopterin synthase sulfur carrier subunit